MAGTFFDTSALVKHYHTEAGSAEVDRAAIGSIVYNIF
jgi:hypothetical protein